MRCLCLTLDDFPFPISCTWVMGSWASAHGCLAGPTEPDPEILGRRAPPLIPRGRCGARTPPCRPDARRQAPTGVPEDDQQTYSYQERPPSSTGPALRRPCWHLYDTNGERRWPEQASSSGAKRVVRVAVVNMAEQWRAPAGWCRRPWLVRSFPPAARIHDTVRGAGGRMPEAGRDQVRTRRNATALGRAMQAETTTRACVGGGTTVQTARAAGGGR